MNRRSFLGVSLTILGGCAWAFSSKEAEQTGDFDRLLATFESDPKLVENAWLYRDASVSRGVGVGAKSSTPIAQKAVDMIVRLEVGSQARYERLYQSPIWPKGDSGVTIGIGYDLRFATKQLLHRDWDNRLDGMALSALESGLRLKGREAESAAKGLSAVQVPWDAAYAQFTDFLPYTANETEGVFANCDRLSPESFGALVSLVFNRGSAIPRNKPARAEMVRIHDLMADKRFDEVADQIRAMKRLWTTDDARGLVIRRELEARLFESGLR